MEGGGKSKKAGRGSGFGSKVQKCGTCRTCLNPALKRPCVSLARSEERAPRPAAAAAAPRFQETTTRAVIDALLPVETEKPLPPHGVSGFKLPIEPTQRARKAPQELTTTAAPCWLLRWAPDGETAAAEPPSRDGELPPRAAAEPPAERLPPFSDTTTRAAAAERAAAAAERAAAAAQRAASAAAAATAAAPAPEAGAVVFADALPGGPPPPGGSPEPAGAIRKQRPAQPRLVLGADEAPPPGWLLCDEPFCRACFEKPGQLARHRAVHKERPHVCAFPGCGAAFIESAKLKRHENIHAERAGGLFCTEPGCPSAHIQFNTKVEREAHLRTHPNLAYRFICPYPNCVKAYMQAYKLKLHWRDFHEPRGDPAPAGREGALQAAGERAEGGDAQPDEME